MANGPFQVLLIKLGCPEDVQAGGVIQISWTANPEFQQDEILRTENPQSQSKDGPNDRSAQGSLRRSIPCPQPINLNSAKEYTQPCGSRIATQFKDASPTRLKQLLKVSETSRFKEEDQINILGRPADSPGFKSGPAG